MNTALPNNPHGDGLEWLREVRRRMFQHAGGDLKKLGDRYRAIQTQHPEKTFDPHDTIIRAVRDRRGQR